MYANVCFTCMPEMPEVSAWFHDVPWNEDPGFAAEMRNKDIYRFQQSCQRVEFKRSYLTTDMLCERSLNISKYLQVSYHAFRPALSLSKHFDPNMVKSAQSPSSISLARMMTWTPWFSSLGIKKYVQIQSPILRLHVANLYPFT